MSAWNSARPARARTSSRTPASCSPPTTARISRSTTSPMWISASARPAAGRRSSRSRRPRLTRMTMRSPSSRMAQAGSTIPRRFRRPVAFHVLANDTDADGDALHVTDIDDGPAHGTATISADGMTVLYTPFEDFSGTDSFVYCISDNNGGTDFATVNVTIEAVADIPDLAYQILARRHGQRDHHQCDRDADRLRTARSSSTASSSAACRPA